MPRTDFRKEYEPVTELTTKVWYRSPLWSDDHLLGEPREFYEDGIAWCGRPLADAMNISDEKLGGLFISERKSGKCSQCRVRQEEWDAAQQT